MSIWGKIFGTDKAVDNLLDKDKGLLVRAGGWVDGLYHTEQEKAENALLVKEWGIRQLEALAPFKVVQRILAFTVASFWWVVGVNVLLAIWIEAIFPKIQVYERLLEFAFSDFVFWPVCAVLALYFTGGLLPGKGRS